MKVGLNIGLRAAVNSLMVLNDRQTNTVHSQPSYYLAIQYYVVITFVFLNHIIACLWQIYLMSYVYDIGLQQQ